MSSGPRSAGATVADARRHTLSSSVPVVDAVPAECRDETLDGYRETEETGGGEKVSVVGPIRRSHSRLFSEAGRVPTTLLRADVTLVWTGGGCATLKSWPVGVVCPHSACIIYRSMQKHLR